MTQTINDIGEIRQLVLQSSWLFIAKQGGYHAAFLDIERAGIIWSRFPEDT